jgi:putative FmdB family regulatory protein
MPLYEYQCSACAHQFERIVKFSDAPLTTCPQCGKATIHQKISAPAVQFKGSGWYVTDYAHKSSAAAVKTDAGPAASAEKSSGESAAPPSTSETASTPKAGESSSSA